MDKEKRVSEKRAEKDHKEDVVLNRVLVWFGAAVVAELVLLLLNRYYINYTTSEIEFAKGLLNAFPIIIGVAAAATAACAVWTYLNWKGGKSRLVSSILAWICGALLVISVVTYLFYASGVQFLCGAVPVAAVLALVFYLYQHEFFAVTVLSALGILGLWIFRRSGGGHQAVVYGYMAILAVALVLAVLACRSMQKGGGVLEISGKKLHLFSRNTAYGMIYATCALVAVVLIAAFVLGSSAAYYLIFAMVAWLFVMAVYYTVKLM